MRSTERSYGFLLKPIDAEQQPLRITAGELHKNREAYKDMVVEVSGILRAIHYQMGGDSRISVVAEELVVSSGWRQFYVVIDGSDLSVMPVAEPLNRNQWKDLEGKRVTMKVAVREIKGPMKLLTKLRNSLVSDEHKVTCIPQILELAEDDGIKIELL